MKPLSNRFNSALSYYQDNTQFNAEDGEAGILFSESDVRNGIADLRTSMLSGIPGITSGFATFAGIGISFNETNGQFDLNTNELSDALTNNPDGVRDLFVNSGSSSEPGIRFIALSGATDVSQPFSVDITQAASKAQIAANSALAATTTITDGVNDEFNITVNNRSYTPHHERW